MQTRTSKPANPLLLAFFMLGIQVVWGAILGISLQARSLQLSGSNALIAFGYLFSGGATVAAITQLVAGYWSDFRRQHGSRRIEFYLVGAIAGAVAIGFFYGATNFVTLALAYGALQLGINVAIGPYQAIIPDFVERAKMGVASSWMAALQSIGNAIGAIFASFIADARTITVAIDVFLVGSCVATCAYVRGLTERELPPHPKLHVSREFVDLFISRFFVYVGFFTLVGYLLFYVSGVLEAKDLAAARFQSGVLILIFTLVGAAGAALAARPTDRMNKVHVATVGGLGMVAALVLFIASHNLVWAAVATCLAGFGWGIFLVADWALACRFMPQGAAGTTMGIWNLALVVPQIATGTLTSLVLAGIGMTGASQGPRAAFGLAIGETLLGLAWLWRLSHCADGE